MIKRYFGNDMEVFPVGLGCMGIAEFYEKHDESVGVETIRKAFENGVNYFDTADMYGCGYSEKMIAKAISDNRDKVIISTKFGFVRSDDNVMNMKLDGSPKYVKQACEASLTRLNTDYIDIYYLHRVDPNVPIEDTVGAMKKLVEEGKIRSIALSDTDEETLKRAHKIHPIVAYQSEYSIWHRDPENSLLPLCEALGVKFVPYSPLGRGFLTGKLRLANNFNEGDFRNILPRFQSENFEKNLKILEKLEEFSKNKNCTVAQLSLAWLLAISPNIIPIPGGTTPTHIMENIQAVNVNLSIDDMHILDQLVPVGSAVGDAYPSTMNVH